MTEYHLIEMSNQQAHRDSPHMPLTPRVESASIETYTSLSDMQAVVTASASPATGVPTIITFNALGRMLTASHLPLTTGGLHYHLIYNLTDSVVEIVASSDATAQAPAPLTFILPIVARPTETVTQTSLGEISITKPNGTLLIRTDAPQGFAPISASPDRARTFNLVPGFQCVPLTVTLQPGKETRIQISAPAR